MVMNLLFRLVLVLLGAVFAASLAAAAALVLAVWGARAAWARLAGRPAPPFIIRVDPFAAFSATMHRAGQGRRVPAAETAPLRAREIADVTDVEPRSPR